MDTTGGEGLGRFWADVLGLEFEPDGGPGDVVGPTEGHGIAMCRVPEAKTVKHRVHIDVKAASVPDLEARGATVVRPAEESGLRWTVMTDPEGGEFCAFVRDPAELPDYRFYALVVDAVDAHQIARWWGEVFGAEPKSDEHDDFWYLENVPGMPFEAIVFVPVPEPKTVKNRIHWDVYGTVDALRDRGATLLRARDDGPSTGSGQGPSTGSGQGPSTGSGQGPSTGSGQGISWNVMADPEGNEFCVFER